jgi:cytidine deaminase
MATADADPNTDSSADTGADIDWNALRLEAKRASSRAYAPYSKFQVGAAGLVDDGRIVTGCNVENASYGLALCAECGLVSQLLDSGGGRLIAVSIVSGSGRPCAPCGRCRQLLFEHGGPDCQVDCGPELTTVGELLPDGFGPDRLAEG